MGNDTASHIRALLVERDACLRSGQTDRVAAIDEQLRLFGHEGAPPVKRAAKRKQADGMRP